MMRMPVTDPDFRSHIAILAGLTHALDTLEEEAKDFDKLPGIVLAKALIGRKVAENRSRLSSLCYRAAAHAGWDLLSIRTLYTDFDGNDWWVIGVNADEEEPEAVRP